jgi:hypothetical protein
MADLYLLFVLLVGGMVGCVQGGSIGAQFGLWGRLCGAVLGVGVVWTAGLGLQLVYLVLMDLVCPPRTVPPCENGMCTEYGHFKQTNLAAELVAQFRGLSSYARTCRCGNVYAGGNDWPLRNRCVRVMDDGTLRPYLNYRSRGRWQPDSPDSVIAVPPETPHPVFDHWASPLVVVLIVSGILLGFEGVEFLLTRGRSRVEIWPIAIMTAFMCIVVVVGQLIERAQKETANK